MAVVHITNETFEKEVMQAEGKVHFPLVKDIVG